MTGVMPNSLEAIADSIQARRFRFSSEVEIQDGIAEVLTAAGIPL